MDKPKINYCRLSFNKGKYNLANFSEESTAINIYFPEDMQPVWEDKKLDRATLANVEDTDYLTEDSTLDDVAEFMTNNIKKYWINTGKKKEEFLRDWLKLISSYNERQKTIYEEQLARYELEQAQINFEKKLKNKWELPVLNCLKDKEGNEYYRCGKAGYYGNGKTPFEAVNNYDNAEEMEEVIELKQKIESEKSTANHD